MMRTASGCKPEDGGRVVAVEIGRLGRGGDFDAVADAPRPAGFGFDIGVFDEAGLEVALDDELRRGQRRLDIAARHAALDEDIAWPVGMELRRIGRDRLLPASVRLAAPAR